MSRKRERQLRQTLTEVSAPGESQAAERGWRVVREAFAEREPHPRVRRPGLRAALAVTGAALIAAFALTPAGADVREWIADRLDGGEEDARPVLGALPAPGALLTESAAGVWILRDDGSRRHLGDYDRATWSPNGLYVGVADGRELLALTPQGMIRWRLLAARPISALDWSSDEGFRVAYVTGRELRVVAADNTGDVALEAGVGSPAIAWRPETAPARAIHHIAYVDAANRVTLRDSDSGEVRWRSAPVAARVESLQWSADGDRLAVVAGDFVLLLEGDGTSRFKGPIAGGIGAATLSPDGEHLAVVRPARRGGAELALVPTEPGTRAERVLYPRSPTSGAAGFGRPTFSPDGEWIVLPWPRVDQWLFVPLAGGRPFATAGISRQLDADRGGPSSFPRVAGWCC